MTTKDRPAVDPTVFALAERFLDDYTIVGDKDLPTTELFEDATWDLADAIQYAIGTWLDDATNHGRTIGSTTIVIAEK